MLQSITQKLGFKLILWNTLHKGNFNEHVEGMKLDLSGSVGGENLNFSTNFMKNVNII
jgi:hypothetical protein